MILHHCFIVHFARFPVLFMAFSFFISFRFLFLLFLHLTRVGKMLRARRKLRFVALPDEPSLTRPFASYWSTPTMCGVINKLRLNITPTQYNNNGKSNHEWERERERERKKRKLNKWEKVPCERGEGKKGVPMRLVKWGRQTNAQ